MTQGRKQNLRNHVQLSMSSTVLQYVCKSSWETNLELRESDTGIVGFFEDHYNADQQIQLWYCQTQICLKKPKHFNTWKVIIDF